MQCSRRVIFRVFRTSLTREVDRAETEVEGFEGAAEVDERRSDLVGDIWQVSECA